MAICCKQSKKDKEPPQVTESKFFELRKKTLRKKLKRPKFLPSFSQGQNGIIYIFHVVLALVTANFGALTVYHYISLMICMICNVILFLVTLFGLYLFTQDPKDFEYLNPRKKSSAKSKSPKTRSKLGSIGGSSAGSSSSLVQSLNQIKVKQNRPVPKIFIITAIFALMAVAFITLTAQITLLAPMKSQHVKSYVLNYYRQNREIMPIMENIQIEKNCCGIVDVWDYTNIIKNSFSSTEHFIKHIPPSCCKKSVCYNRTELQKHEANEDVFDDDNDYIKAMLNASLIHRKGCLDMNFTYADRSVYKGAPQTYQKMIIFHSLPIIGLFLLQIPIIIILTRFLIQREKNMRNALLQGIDLAERTESGVVLGKDFDSDDELSTSSYHSSSSISNVSFGSGGSSGYTTSGDSQSPYNSGSKINSSTELGEAPGDLADIIVEREIEEAMRNSGSALNISSSFENPDETETDESENSETDKLPIDSKNDDK